MQSIAAIAPRLVPRAQIVLPVNANAQPDKKSAAVFAPTHKAIAQTAAHATMVRAAKAVTLAKFAPPAFAHFHVVD